MIIRSIPLTSIKQGVNFVSEFLFSAPAMYRNFFSLSDLPFSISPDPKYLFMSDRHREALSHLTYGLGEVGGFALLTGEVGTGKTTVSRCLMEQLPDNTEAAFILNPTLSSQELLATLCDELNISYQKEAVSLKHLTDKISEKLLKNHQNDLNTLLIIDEAQHLQPEVLEQLRLLTNLETNTKKLLQVILIGQPELQQLLQRRDLRQLAQRITARYHLMPLTKQELSQYIQHRLSVADCVRPIFDSAAINKIHQLSQGIPRLINLLCHSALMIAYNQNQSVVYKKTVIAAAEHALGAEATSKQGVVHYKSALVLTTTLSVAAFIALASFWWGSTQSPVIHSMDSEPNVVLNNAKAAITPLVLADTTFIEPTSMKNKPSLVVVSSDKDHRNESNYSPQEIVPEYGLYTVHLGDTLSQIAVNYNVKLSALCQWNNITETTAIVVGDKLYVVNPQNTLGIRSTVLGETLIKNRTSNNVNEVNSRQFKDNKSGDTLFVSAEKKSLKNTLTSTSTKRNNADINYKVTQVDGVSNDLLSRFQDAIEETENEAPNKAEISEFKNDQPSVFNGDITNVKSLTQMPQNIQNALPILNFEQHIYASDGHGWVTVNGRDRYEGDYINDDLRVDTILPQHVILSFQGEQFSLPALTNW